MVPVRSLRICYELVLDGIGSGFLYQEDFFKTLMWTYLSALFS